MIALTVIRLKKLAVADSEKNQHISALPSGLIARDFKMNSMDRSMLKLAFCTQKDILLNFHARYNRQNLNARPADEARRTCKRLSYQTRQAKAA